MGGRISVWLVVCVLALAATGCKKKSETTESGGTPATAGSAGGATEVPAPGGSSTTPTAVQGTPVTPATTETKPPLEELDVESKDILSREPVTAAAQVQHILVGWADIAGPRSDRRAFDRTKAEADHLAAELLGKVKNGMNMEALMQEHSEDPGSAQTGEPYPVRPESDFVPEFEALSLRLNVGEAGICRTQFGYHIIKRIQ
ncbi:MAG: peptidylprolyl isomerase [Deltaproteobacteria bacterium]|nr:peptidylprolyl isomerase [Deltaproteobacteria bacterium]